VGGGVDAQRQTRCDAPALRRQLACEVARVGQALWRGVAAAHDGQDGTPQHRRIALQVQQQWWISGLQQRRWVSRVARGDGMAVGSPGQPCARSGQAGLGHLAWPAQGLRHRVASQLA
jgi:hypothetical protein